MMKTLIQSTKTLSFLATEQRNDQGETDLETNQYFPMTFTVMKMTKKQHYQGLVTISDNV